MPAHELLVSIAYVIDDGSSADCYTKLMYGRLGTQELLYDFLGTVNAAPLGRVNIRHNEAWCYSKVTVSSCDITSVQTQNTLFSP